MLEQITLTEKYKSWVDEVSCSCTFYSLVPLCLQYIGPTKSKYSARNISPKKPNLNQKLHTFTCEFFLQISELFGGMEVCGVSVVVGKDGREYIIKASDSTFALMGDTQEDDRRQIADLVTQRMQVT